MMTRGSVGRLGGAMVLCLAVASAPVAVAVGVRTDRAELQRAAALADHASPRSSQPDASVDGGAESAARDELSTPRELSGALADAPAAAVALSNDPHVGAGGDPAAPEGRPLPHGVPRVRCEPYVPDVVGGIRLFTEIRAPLAAPDGPDPEPTASPSASPDGECE